ncbi:hypothetical protein ABIA31_003476 [Catenulispora sp. MAP5-51]|uniref:transglutaminase-like domain-containing protein n=1 Tax=Catenulispora sp. MAP5-51 TaxID=3156298 RepID=UPI0035154743
MGNLIDYRSPGPFTDVRAVDPAALRGLATDPVDLCRPVSRLVIQPHDAKAAGITAERLAENQIRPAAALVERLMAAGTAPLSQGREPGERVVGTCRHFAVLACALLRNAGTAARVRCGFATYFQPGQALDHWVIEYRPADSARWIRLDPETLGGTVLPNAGDLKPGDFLTGAEAWAMYRRGEVDGATFGVYGTENFGPAEIRGNAVKDLAALNKVESLPWDEWGQMTEAYEGRTGDDYDALLDELAAACAGDDAEAIGELYRNPVFEVPAELLR